MGIFSEEPRQRGLGHRKAEPVDDRPCIQGGGGVEEKLVKVGCESGHNRDPFCSAH